MKSPPRSTLDELIAEYSLHKDRKHVYVEGREDYTILKWCFDTTSDPAADIFDIDTVEITAEQLYESGLKEGKKSRVVFLARELNKALPEESVQVLCVVDADFDYILDRIQENRFLAYTDGTSMDLYAYSDSALEKLLRLGLRDFDSNPVEIINSLIDVLSDVFTTRAANEQLNLGLKWIAFQKRCRVEPDGSVNFNGVQFIRDYLSNGQAIERMNEFVECKCALSRRNQSSWQKRVHGHDFAVLLTRYIRCVRRTRLAQEVAKGEAIGRMLFVALERDKMMLFPLFRRIAGFLGSRVTIR